MGEERGEQEDSRGTSSSREPLKSYYTILQQELEQAERELHRARHSLFLSGVLAGLGVTLSVFLQAIVWSRFGGLETPAAALVGASAYSVGFIVVIHARADLFTEYTTIALLPVLTGQVHVRRLARLWALIYAGNVLGAVIMALLTSTLGPSLGVVDEEAFRALAGHLIHHSALVTFGAAVLAGWLMGLLSWLVTAGRDTIGQIFFVWLLTGAIALGHLPHSISGLADVLSGVLTTDQMGIADLGRFVVWTTSGNAIGGILFALLIRWSLVLEARR